MRWIQYVRTRFSVAMVGALVACGSEDLETPRATPEVELGTGRSSFEPIPASGGTLELVGGPQGGFHVFVTARIVGFEIDRLTIEYAAFDAETGEAVGRVATFVLSPARVTAEGSEWVRVGDFLILDDASPEPVRGRTLDIRLTAEEAGTGVTATDERRILVVDDVNG